MATELKHNTSRVQAPSQAKLALGWAGPGSECRLSNPCIQGCCAPWSPRQRELYITIYIYTAIYTYSYVYIPSLSSFWGAAAPRAPRSSGRTGGGWTTPLPLSPPPPSLSALPFSLSLLLPLLPSLPPKSPSEGFLKITRSYIHLRKER